MSLNWDITKVKNHEELYRKDAEDNLELCPMTERIIFLAMEVDIGEITEKNIHEWCVRLAMMKRVGWTPRQGIARADIERHIGLRTNVATKSRAQFRTKVAKAVEREAEDDVKKELKAYAEVVLEAAATALQTPALKSR